jgi:hypothetical protein
MNKQRLGITARRFRRRVFRFPKQRFGAPINCVAEVRKETNTGEL